jgi:hypothetical protein
MQKLEFGRQKVWAILMLVLILLLVLSASPAFAGLVWSG